MTAQNPTQSNRVVYISQFPDGKFSVSFGSEADSIPQTQSRQYYPITQSSLDRINHLVTWNKNVSVHLSPYISVWAEFPARI